MNRLDALALAPMIRSKVRMHGYLKSHYNYSIPWFDCEPIWGVFVVREDGAFYYLEEKI